MYKQKPAASCDMPESDKQFKVLILNGSLKHEPDVSNTEEVTQLVIDNIKSLHPNSEADVVRLADKNIPVGLAFKESDDDDWPEIAKKIREADIFIIATPIWWGGRSSLTQRVIERLDAFDEEYHAGQRSALYNKVAGVVITGSEDGALSTMGTIMMVLSWMGFTLPPECCAYWVGEVGQPTATDRERRLKNEATKAMAKNLARNLVYYARLLGNHPLIIKE